MYFIYLHKEETNPKLLCYSILDSHKEIIKREYLEIKVDSPYLLALKKCVEFINKATNNKQCSITCYSDNEDIKDAFKIGYRHPSKISFVLVSEIRNLTENYTFLIKYYSPKDIADMERANNMGAQQEIESLDF